MSILYLVYVAEEIGLSLAFFRNPEERFCRAEARMVCASERAIILELYLSIQMHYP